MTWTRFKDMHSGGGTKVQNYEYILIELPYRAAKDTFRDLFNRRPDNITCSCCGPDYVTDTYDTLSDALDHRYRDLTEDSDDVLAIHEGEIDSGEEL